MSEFSKKFERFNPEPISLEESKECFTNLNREKQINLIRWVAIVFGERLASLFDTDDYPDSPNDTLLKEIKGRKEFFKRLMNFENGKNLSTNKLNSNLDLTPKDIHDSGPFLIEYLFSYEQEIVGLNKRFVEDTFSRELEESVNSYISESDNPRTLTKEVQDFVNGLE